MAAHAAKPMKAARAIVSPVIVSRALPVRNAPAIAPPRRDALAVLALPSTSPANASIPRAEKLERWREVLRWAPALPRGEGDA